MGALIIESTGFLRFSTVLVCVAPSERSHLQLADFFLMQFSSTSTSSLSREVYFLSSVDFVFIEVEV